MASLLEVYKDHVTAHFARLRTCALKTDSALPPRLEVITPELRLALNQMAKSIRQLFSRYIIPDHECGPIGSLYRVEHGWTCSVNTMPRTRP